MSILDFLHSKAKALVVFVFSLIALGLLIISTVFAASVCEEWFGLVIGIIMMIIAIPFHISAKKFKTGYLISFLLNSAANGFSLSAYIISADIKLSLYKMLVAALPAAGILLLVYLMLQIFNKTKKVTVTVAVCINILLTLLFTALWIIYGDLIFSFGFFCSLVSCFYLCVFGVTVNHAERSVLRDISFGSFGSFIILTVVVIFIISEGDILDGLDIGAGTDSEKRNRKKKK